MSHDELEQLVSDISKQLWASVAAIEMASAGLRKMAQEFAALTPLPENPDPDIFVGRGDPNDASARTYGVWKRSQALAELQDNGPVRTMLTQLWIVATFARWEAEWRPALAEAAGVDVAQIASDVFGDLRLLRNDVVHHLSIATKENSGRCEILRFDDGETIHLNADRFLAIHNHFAVRVVR